MTLEEKKKKRETTEVLDKRGGDNKGIRPNNSGHLAIFAKEVVY